MKVLSGCTAPDSGGAKSLSGAQMAAQLAQVCESEGRKARDDHTWWRLLMSSTSSEALTSK